MRSGRCERATRETVVQVAIDLEGERKYAIATGMPMLDHLLAQFAFHARSDLAITATSLDAIGHHLVEDVALALGSALASALDDRRGIMRYASATVAMDDALARAAVDLGGRPYARADIVVAAERVEGLDTILIPHFFRSLATTGGITLHVDVLAGIDPHHCIEASFKAFALACASAWHVADDRVAQIPSTKGVL